MSKEKKGRFGSRRRRRFGRKKQEEEQVEAEAEASEETSKEPPSEEPPSETSEPSEELLASDPSSPLNETEEFEIPPDDSLPQAQGADHSQRRAHVRQLDQDFQDYLYYLGEQLTYSLESVVSNRFLPLIRRTFEATICLIALVLLISLGLGLGYLSKPYLYWRSEKTQEHQSFQHPGTGS